MFKLRRLLLLPVLGLCIVLYEYFEQNLPLLLNLAGDWSSYFERFGLSFLLLGLVPLGYVLLAKLDLRYLGWRLPEKWPRYFPLILVIVAVSSALGAYNSELFAFYPYSKSLAEKITQGSFIFWWLHFGLYLILFYIPWETLFRGLLILPYLNNKNTYLTNFTIASFQVIPSAMLHVGHPISEYLGALIFGLIGAYLSLETKSIVPALIIHFAAGMALDTVIILRLA